MGKAKAGPKKKAAKKKVTGKKKKGAKLDTFFATVHKAAHKAAESQAAVAWSLTAAGKEKRAAALKRAAARAAKARALQEQLRKRTQIAAEIRADEAEDKMRGARMGFLQAMEYDRKRLNDLKLKDRLARQRRRDRDWAKKRVIATAARGSDPARTVKRLKAIRAAEDERAAVADLNKAVTDGTRLKFATRSVSDSIAALAKQQAATTKARRANRRKLAMRKIINPRLAIATRDAMKQEKLRRLQAKMRKYDKLRRAKKAKKNEKNFFKTAVDQVVKRQLRTEGRETKNAVARALRQVPRGLNAVRSVVAALDGASFSTSKYAGMDNTNLYDAIKAVN